MNERSGCFAGVFAVVALSLGVSAAASEAELSKKILQQDGWVAYDVAMVAGGGTPCCYEFHANRMVRFGCDLDGNTWGFGRDDKDPQRDDTTMTLYAHVHGGGVDKVRAFGASCPVHGAEQARRIEAVDAADSVAWLAQAIARDTTFDNAADAELSALALHQDASAGAALAKFSEAGHPRKLREQALFWSGQMRGASGAQLAERVATIDADPEMRAHAVFVLSQSKNIDGYAAIHRIAQTDASEHVREQALFWMAQTEDARAKGDILAAIDKETSDKVREQAVFALSQLKEQQADAALIALVRGHYPRKVKEQALFWLGQSGSDEALHFIDEVLSERTTRSHDS
jgi:hypothetical protein